MMSQETKLWSKFNVNLRQMKQTHETLQKN